ncbi:unnamed protein product, partial [Allacma fusca]
WNRADPAV